MATPVDERQYAVVYQYAMKKRVRAFTEGVVIMVCPVLLAVALKKVNMKSERNGFVGSISPLSALTLEAGLLPFLCLCLSKLLTNEHSDRLYRFSKLLVHLCALLLMALACGILLLIISKSLPYLAFLVLLVPFTVWLCYRNVCNGPDQDAMVFRGCEDRLEISLDFSAAITTLLFLGLEGLALEGQNSTHQGLDASLCATFVTCALGLCIMLLGTVPSLIADNRSSGGMCNFVEILNIVLVISIAGIVLLITLAPLKESAWVVVVVPLLVPFVVWMYRHLAGDGDRALTGVEAEEECKPASLELTKVTFTGFLAVSVPNVSNTSIGNDTHYFIFFTAAAVISGLGWRLLTHWICRMAPTPTRAMVTAANVASFCAHLCVAVAVIPFTMMAVKAL